MKCSNLCIILFIMIDFSLSVPQAEMKVNRNIETVKLKARSSDVSLEDLDKKMDKIILLIEQNRNLIRNSVATLKTELTSNMESSIEVLKNELTSSKSDILKLTSEHAKVILEVNNIRLNIANLTLSNELNELKIFNNTKRSETCENNMNKLSELKTVSELKLFFPRNCAELRNDRIQSNGIQTVYPFSQVIGQGVLVVCDQHTDKGGWTIFQNRIDLPIRENFTRNWNDYSKGFGNLSGEFWLGLENIHKMTKYANMELRVDLEDWVGVKKFAKYRSFSIESSMDKFRLNLGAYSGNAGDSLSIHKHKLFSTYDQDNDDRSDFNCAQDKRGGWWFPGCGYSTLNGLPLIGKYSVGSTRGIEWYHTRNEWKNSMRKSRMMFRPQ